jgi:hypothetical protein
MPARRVDNLAARCDLRQVDHGSQLTFGAQTPDRAPHQARLAARTRCQRIRKLCRGDGVDQLFVRGTPYVAGTIGLNGSANDKKVLCFCNFVRQRGNLRSTLERTSLILRNSSWLPAPV